jgi:nitrogen fixation/metabolism regulation signal transduction histidine kinase
MASWVSAAIARPIVALTEFTRRYRRDGKLTAAPPGGSGEVEELATAFVDMVAHIDASQLQSGAGLQTCGGGRDVVVMAYDGAHAAGDHPLVGPDAAAGPGLSPEGREMTGFIESETERLNRLVSTMLDSARPRAPVFVPTDVHVLIHQCLGLLAGQAAGRCSSAKP